MKQDIRQGDVILRPVTSIPSVAVKLDTKILQESEQTGKCHHFTKDANVTVYQTKEESSDQKTITPDFGKFVLVDDTGEALLYHGKGFEAVPTKDGAVDHFALRIPPGNYQVIIQREYDYASQAERLIAD